ncbi:MAG TPA: NAD(P)H-dependent glycerol-3-phosphate dehydrogenase [Burkholderiaceae bacterium]|nr:NAD(P)H-dependent glycerol-3-phosphate dehydrogenase [Burkholderiaceae bacterium]
MNLGILGAGAWGTALAARAALRHPTVLWARDAAQAAQMRDEHRNARYLRDVALPEALRIEADFDAAVAHARGAGAQGGLLIVATPMSGLREMLQRLSAQGDDGTGVLWLCKGFEHGSGLLGHELARDVAPRLRAGVLSGPSFAIEVARGQPTALVAASDHAALCDAAVAALHGDNLRVYTSNDAVGVEVGGAVKNVLALAAGMADGMQADRSGGAAGMPTGLGLNARAALVTRGLAEMTRLGVALGARPETFMGLSGLGDLVLTATGDLSRNRTVGRLLAQGVALPRILAELGHVAEGVSTAPMVLARARAAGVEMPITQAVAAVLQGAITPAQALEQLMGRDARSEAV